MASSLTLAGNADFNGNLDVDGTTNLDAVDIDGAVDMASSLTLAGNADFNGNLDVDGTTDLDTTNIVGTLTVTGNVVPEADGSRDLGTNSVRWANVYADDVRTGDLHLSNEHRGVNTIDGTWGHYQIEEGSDDLFLKNKRTGKTYKFMLQEV